MEEIAINAREAEILRRAVRAIVELLAENDYQATVEACAKSRLSPDDIRGVIEEYGHHLIRPPEDAYADLDAIRVTQASEPTWSVRAPVYTANEGRSDLTLELTIIQSSGEIRIEMDDLHVL